SPPMLPEGKRGPPTNGHLPHNWRFSRPAGVRWPTSDGELPRAERQALPAERDFAHFLAAQDHASLGDAGPAHGLIEEAGIVLGMAPDQAGMMAAFLERRESPVEQGTPHASAQEAGRDI